MKLFTILSLLAVFFVSATPVLAVQNSDIATFTGQTLNTFLVIASLAATFFLVKGGFVYITSTGKPDALEHAKITIRNAIIGLVLVIGAAVISSVLNNAFTTPTPGITSEQIRLIPIVPATPSDGLTRVLLDAIEAFLQNIVQSSAKPLTDAIIGFLSITPNLASNSVVFNFWLIILGITDSLFALVVALLGFHFMSASTFGFEEMELRQLLPRIGLAFLGANTSIFLADFVISICNVLTQALLHATGGLGNDLILNSFNPVSIIAGQTNLLLLIFMLLFVILAVVLLLFYITRLIVVALGAVLAPLIFLLWITPKFSDFAEISMKTYITMVFTVFVQLVIIQLASAFLLIPGQQGTNSLLSVLVGVGLLLTLLKSPSVMMQLVFYNSGRGMVKKISGQIMNVITTSKVQDTNAAGTAVKTPRRVVAA